MERRKLFFLLGGLILTVLLTVLVIKTYSGPVEPSLRRDEAQLRRERVLHMLRKGESLLRSHRYAEAGKLLHQLRRLDPENLRCRFLLGQLFYQRGEFDAAVAMFRNLAELLPRDPVILNNFGQSLVRAGHRKEGVAVLERALGYDRESWPIARNLAAARALENRPVGGPAAGPYRSAAPDSSRTENRSGESGTGEAAHE